MPNYYLPFEITTIWYLFPMSQINKHMTNTNLPFTFTNNQVKVVVVFWNTVKSRLPNPEKVIPYIQNAKEW
jgi:hypothetical protein